MTTPRTGRGYINCSGDYSQEPFKWLPEPIKRKAPWEPYTAIQTCPVCGKVQKIHLPYTYGYRTTGIRPHKTRYGNKS
jgi:hypothetical protein